MDTASKTSTLAACLQVFRLSLRRQFFTRQTIVMLVLLALAVLGFAWLWLDQLGRTQRFERRVSLLESELAVARDDLVASEARMQDVRSGIEGLTTQLGALRGLAGLSPDSSLAPEAVDAGSVDDLVPAD